MNKRFWNKYYRAHRIPGPPSAFARFVTGFLLYSPCGTLLDLGCGNGRDTIFLSNYCTVTGIDECAEEIQYLQSHYACADFEVCNLSKKWDLPSVDYVYARFFFHAIPEPVEDRLLSSIYNSLRLGGMVFIEARSSMGAFKQSGKYRRFMESDRFTAKLKHYGFSIIYCLESTGLATTATEDPPIIRIVAQKR